MDDYRTAELSKPPGLGPLDYLFRGVALLGVLEWGSVVWNVLGHPSTPGIAGQSYGVRLLMTAVIGPGLLGMGILLVWRVPRNVIGRYLILVGLTITAAQYDFQMASPALSVLALELFLLIGSGLALPSLIYLMLHFPTGRVYPQWLAPWVLGYGIVKLVGVGLDIMASPYRLVVVDLPINPLLVPSLVPYHALIAVTIGAAGLLLPLGGVVGLASMVQRYRAAGERERVQIKWVAWAGALFLLFLPIQVTLFATGVLTRSVMLFDLAAVVGGSLLLALVGAIGISILRHRLFNIDVLINRTLVYGGLTTLIIGLYALVVGGLGALFETTSNIFISFLATGLVAVIFQPLRDRLQRGVNHLMYGERDDPYAVLSRLGQQLEANLAPDTVLPTIVETVAQALKLPYVALGLVDDDGPLETDSPPGPRLSSIIAVYGTPVAGVFRLPLVYQGATVGELIVAPRTPGEPLTVPDRRLLTDIAHQAGVAAHAVRLTTALQRSRQRLVTAREEERRRLRRDLHDGLGPTLASMTLKLDATRNLLHQDVRAADAMLADLKRQTQDTVSDIRRLVYDLRPPALDDLGLLGALRLSAAQYSPGLKVVVSGPEYLVALPAAVEVAAYRIALEALTNTVHHAQTQRCDIHLWLEANCLQLEVVDDGVGLPAAYRAGVGMTSMRERAVELGGTCVVQSAPGGGTRVLVQLPLDKEALWIPSVS